MEDGKEERKGGREERAYVYCIKQNLFYLQIIIQQRVSKKFCET